MPDRDLHIIGHKLKIAGTEEEAIGVYFINQDTQESTKVDATDIVTNNPSKLIAVIPRADGRNIQGGSHDAVRRQPVEGAAHGCIRQNTYRPVRRGFYQAIEGPSMK
jgi:hypothetical protein